MRTRPAGAVGAEGRGQDMAGGGCGRRGQGSEYGT